MIDSIIDSLKGEVVEGLTNKLGLSSTEVDKTLSSTKDAFDKTVSEEAGNNGLETLTNLFSDNENSSSSNGLISSLGENLASSLSSNGFSSDKVSSIQDVVLPVLIKLVSEKIGGNSQMLSGLLGKGDIQDKASGLIKGLFN
jgi:hypothetical protein